MVRLCAAGATVRTWSVGRGDEASIEAPAGISAELLREVKARGWRVIPGGRANPEAVHDSWLAGVPIAEFEPSAHSRRYPDRAGKRPRGATFDLSITARASTSTARPGHSHIDERRDHALHSQRR